MKTTSIIFLSIFFANSVFAQVKTAQKTVLTTVDKIALASNSSFNLRVESAILKWAVDIMNAEPSTYSADEYAKLTSVAHAILNNSDLYTARVTKVIAYVGFLNYKIAKEAESEAVITYEGTNEDSDIQFTVNSIMPSFCGVYKGIKK